MIYSNKIAVIGLGYVGLPLSLEFGKKFITLGFDINKERVKQLINGLDINNEFNKNDFKISKNLEFTNQISDIKGCNIYIVTVPTPLDKHQAPDLNSLIQATTMIGSLLKKKDIVIYESTVYPGCTEEECVPVLEKESGLKFNLDFSCGYSPERVNPGDKVNTLSKIVKVTSGSNKSTADFVDQLYSSIIEAGTFKAVSIKVAEASKVIENAQRDVNISFVNELALIFDRLNLDTNDVIDAASTKWNFIKLRPGLVGGHCISVDPYYLAHKAKMAGYYPEVILSGRRVNENMSKFITSACIKLMINKGQKIKNLNALILGVTFKENCGDIRNSKVFDIHNELLEYGLNVDLFDPHANKEEVKKEYGLNLVNINSKYNLIILAVSHSEFSDLNIINLKADNKTVIYDVKSFLDRTISDKRL